MSNIGEDKQNKEQSTQVTFSRGSIFPLRDVRPPMPPVKPPKPDNDDNKDKGKND